VGYKLAIVKEQLQPFLIFLFWGLYGNMKGCWKEKNSPFISPSGTDASFI